MSLTIKDVLKLINEKIIASPDMDIFKLSEFINEIKSQSYKEFLKTEDSNCHSANLFWELYNNISTQTPSINIETFIFICGEGLIMETIDIDLLRQFNNIIMFYKEKNDGKIEDTKIKNLSIWINEVITMEDIKDENSRDFNSGKELEMNDLITIINESTELSDIKDDNSTDFDSYEELEIKKKNINDDITQDLLELSMI